MAVDFRKLRHTQLALVWSSPFPLKFLVGEQGSLEAEENTEPPDCARKGVDHRTNLQLPPIVCPGSSPSPLPQVLLLRINISTGLITRLVPGQLALACIWR